MQRNQRQSEPIRKIHREFNFINRRNRIAVRAVNDDIHVASGARYRRQIPNAEQTQL